MTETRFSEVGSSLTSAAYALIAQTVQFEMQCSRSPLHGAASLLHNTHETQRVLLVVPHVMLVV